MFKQKLLIVLSVICTVFGLNAQFTVQGIPYDNPKAQKAVMSASASGVSENGTFTFDRIQNWTGEGTNQAALVIQWNDERETSALVFGYRWNGEATAYDMIAAVAAADPRFNIIRMKDPNDPSLGYSFAGMGWDNDESGDFTILLNDEVQTPVSEGIYETDSYQNHDHFTVADPNDFWQAGWYKGYWAFYVKDSADASFGYSGSGASNVKLVNGAWNGWNYCVKMQEQPWKEFAAAPVYTPIVKKTDFYVNGVYYKLVNNSAKTVEVVAPFEYEGQPAVAYAGDITIPETFVDGENTYTVVSVAEAAFKSSAVTSVVLPESVTSVGANAFQYCSKLTAFKIPSAVTKIEPFTFSRSGLLKIDVPATVTEIGASAFERCQNAKTITLHENLETVGAFAFKGCLKIVELEIPVSVKSVGNSAFNTPKLKTVRTCQPKPLVIADDVFYSSTYSGTLVVPVGSLQAYKQAAGWKNFATIEEMPVDANLGDVIVVDNICYKITANSETQKELTVVHYGAAENITDPDRIAAANKAGYTGSVVVPAAVKYLGKDYKVVAVADNAFYGAEAMTSLSIAEIENLGQAFCGNCSGLESVTLPETLKVLPSKAFYYCKKLAIINELTAIETVGDRAFYYCQLLPKPVLSAGTTAVGDYAFYNCSALTEVTWPAAADAVAPHTFDYCRNLATVTLGENVTTLGAYSFANCPKLVQINIPAKVAALPDYVFSKAGFAEMAIPKTVKTLGNGVFSGCANLAKVTVPEKVAFGTGVFENCTALTSVRLPNSLVDIPDKTFSGCSLLKTATLSKNTNTLGAFVFFRTAIEKFTFPANLTTVGRACFDGCKALTTVKINNKVEKLSQRLFAETNLTELVIPANVTTLESNLLNGCLNENVKVWLCQAVPAKITNNRTFEIAYKKYASLVVPYGTTETYKALPNWSNDKFMEVAPVVESVKAKNVTVTETTAALNGAPVMTYNETVVPAPFTAVNNTAYMNAENEKYTVYAEYRKANSDAEFVKTDAAWAEGVYTANTDNLLMGTKYEYRWILSDNGVETPSKDAYFKTAGDIPLSDYTNGFFMLNEDWFGHNNSSINFVSPEDSFYYNVFQAANPGSTLGTTAQYGTIYGGKMFIICKQNASDGGAAGGRIIVADPKTMKLIASVDKIDGPGVDGRTFIGVTDKLGYVGTSEGVYTFDTENYVVGGLIAGTNVEIGDMVRYQDYVFATGRNKGVFVIDTKTDKLVKTISVPKIATVFVTYSGGLYASGNGKGASGFYKIDPYTFEKEAIVLADNMGVADPWFAWQPGKVASSMTENVIYYATGGWSITNIHKYDFDTNTLTSNFAKCPGGQMIYGAITTNPETGDVITTTQKSGFGQNSKYNWMHVLNTAEGGIKNTVAMKEGFWFPSMEIYNDNVAPVVSGLDGIKLDIDFDQTFNAPLLDLVDDADNYNVSISAEIKNIQGAQFMNVKLENGSLVINPVDDGEASFDLVVNSNGKYVTKHVTVSVIRSTSVDETFATRSDITCCNGILTVRANAEGMVQVFNAAGQQVMTDDVVEGENEYSLSDLEDGVYVVKYNNAVKKIVK